MTEVRIRESRMNPKYPSYPGKVEYGCLHQTLATGPMDRVYIAPLEEAIEDVISLRARGIKAALVHRTVPEWEGDDYSLSDLRDLLAVAKEEEAEARRQRLARLEEEENRRATEDDGLGWKEL